MITPTLAVPAKPATDDDPDTALLAAALAICALALAGGGVISRVRREAGLA
jgi:LPXTG-motif cell wall-anchored protein